MPACLAPPSPGPENRAKAAAAIQALGSRHPHVRVVAGLKKTKTVGEFYELLRDVKFFVSPYGYGEFANKDYEAILSGCVLVCATLQCSCS